MGANQPMASDDPIFRYLELGLRLGRHLDGLVDAYYGPNALAERVADEPLHPLEALVVDARSLVAAIDAGDGPVARDARRHRWLRAQAAGLHAAARKLAGEPIGYVDEVEQCYGVRPALVPHERFREAHRLLEQILPGTGPLADRYERWRSTHLMDADQLRAAVAALAEVLRDRTAAAFGLPEGERVDFELVADQPWAGFNYYEGDLRSRVAINTDLPVSSAAVAHLVAHEAYPGHHTEHCRKEVGLVRRRRQLEESIFLVGTPQCVLAEGLADLAFEALLGDDRHRVVAEVLAPLGIRFDTEVVAAVAEASEALGAVRANAALLLHDRGASADEAVDELVTWGLVPRERAERSLAFLTHPTWRAYVFCYTEGLARCRSFVAGDPRRFDRLLAEQFVPDDLVSGGSSLDRL